MIFRWLQKREDKKQRALLILLENRGEMRGLDIVKASKGVFKRGTIYTFLRRMTDYGYLNLRRAPFEDVGAGLSPPYYIHHYSVTQKGRDRLQELGESLPPYR